MALLGVCIMCLILAGSTCGGKVHFSPRELNFPLDPETARLQKDNKDVMNNFKRLNIQSDKQTASTAFMVNLFNVLQSGSSLVKAAGRGNLNQADLTLSDTIRSFTPKDISAVSENSRVHLQFKIPNLPTNERLRLAEIRCLRHKALKVKNKKRKFKIAIFKGGNLAKKLTVRTRSVSQDNYDVFDISRAFTPIINGYHGNVTISIKLPLRYNKELFIDLKQYALIFYLENHNFLKSMVEKFEHKVQSMTSQETTSRRRRSTRDRKLRHKKIRRNKKGKNDGCRLYDFYVNFNTIGWDQWIIHPARFNAKVCDGKCSSPIDVRHKPTNHAMLQSLMRSKRSNSVPAPCCVPTKLEPLSMMYIEHDEIVVRHHDDMVAAECGCR